MNVTFEFIGPEESWQIFDTTARRLLGISGQTFIERWDAGHYGDGDEIDLIQVAMLRPHGR